ncbi:hypothetical protein [Prosthecobacter sp.]|uniref:hypothetical protein n=1 Tax=Prosthecobacter sp. TaxID=1965333 RepID=UPI003783038B
MKRAILLFLFCATSAVVGESSPLWPGVQFTEVRAYAWPNDEVTEAVILDGMTLKPGVINKDGALLTAQQTKRLLAAITGKHPWHPVASCHIPHNAFVFYDAAHHPVASVELCFGCFNHRIQPGGTSRYLDFPSLASIFDEHKLPMGAYPDYKAFKKKFDEVSKLAK